MIIQTAKAAAMAFRYSLLRALVAIIVIGYLQGCGGIAKKEEATFGSSDSVRKAALYRQYGEWKGTKYRLGGSSKWGVDCSGFVYLTYRSKFGISLPRTTTYQSAQGVVVSRKALRPGDLVFFKTGAGRRHVGIFVEKRKFLHASATRGVMLSSLDNSYWAAKYWTARRIEQDR
jgi:lipoprotein Spr/probable lipoprotein NlpC